VFIKNPKGADNKKAHRDDPVCNTAVYCRKIDYMKIIKDLAISESGFVFNPITGESFTVNEIGVSIINQLKESKNDQEIMTFLKGEYKVEPNELEKDFTDFMNMLKHHNLIIS
jgi:Coenzyme PQQ synthesis protein D (PqqD)